MSLKDRQVGKQRHAQKNMSHRDINLWTQQSKNILQNCSEPSQELYKRVQRLINHLSQPKMIILSNSTPYHFWWIKVLRTRKIGLWSSMLTQAWHHSVQLYYYFTLTLQKIIFSLLVFHVFLTLFKLQTQKSPQRHTTETLSINKSVKHSCVKLSQLNSVDVYKSNVY